VTGLRCSEVEARFVDAVDGRLDSADSVRFHAHIEGCASCRERAALWHGLLPGLRAAVPPAPPAMATRRMQIEIERRLAARTAPSPARRWKLWWAPAGGLAVAAAAAFVFWLRAGSIAPAPAVGYAAFASLHGAVSVGDRPPAFPGARVPVAAPIALASGAGAELALDGGARLRVEGPARLALDGSARDVAVRLTEGKLQAEVAHRLADQTFAVITNDMRVEVRGTRFTVVATAAGSRVDVSEGQVAVRFADGRTSLVSAGGSADSTAPAQEPEADESPATTGASDRSPATAAASCADVARSCQATARAVRASMRGGGSERALRLIAEARREMRAADASCEGRAGACEDELGYLHAEALNQAGRLDDATAAYRALDRRGAPAAMRQNALYAAAQIERRQGRMVAAAADFERALAAAPRGALHEDALVGAMESAQGAGDAPRARALAVRYLNEFPRGLAAPAARRLAGDGAP
jgi:ferric-dicitrate binding protein FerR (iron transport regulator)